MKAILLVMLTVVFSFLLSISPIVNAEVLASKKVNLKNKETKIDTANLSDQVFIHQLMIKSKSNEGYLVRWTKVSRLVQSFIDDCDQKKSVFSDLGITHDKATQCRIELLIQIHNQTAVLRNAVALSNESLIKANLWSLEIHREEADHKARLLKQVLKEGKLGSKVAAKVTDDVIREAFFNFIEQLKNVMNHRQKGK